MATLKVLDASVVIGFLDPRDAHHEAAVTALEEDAEWVLPASAYSEVLVAPMRRGEKEAAEAERVIVGVPIRIEPLTRDIARAAARLRARHRGLRTPDALVLATGEALGVEVVTADGRWKRFSARTRTL